MRILHALSQTELTGSEAYAQLLVSEQTRQGHQVFLVSDRIHLAFEAQYFPLALSTSSPWVRWLQILKLRHYLRAQKIEVIHCHSRGACRHLYWAALGLKIPIITTLHGYQHSSFSKRWWDIYGDHILCICENIRDQLIRDFHIPAHKIEVLRNPIRVTSESLDSQKPVRRSPLLVLAGRASGPKGEKLKQLLRTQGKAWLMAQPQLRIRFILSGLSEGETQSLQLELNHPRIQVIGHQIPLQEHLREAQIVIASGRIALEALEKGCQVYAMGESQVIGFVSESRVNQALHSNFGDVGPVQEWSPHQVSLELLPALQKLESSESAPGAKAQDASKSLLQEFAEGPIQERILDLYRGLRLQKRSGWLPILMYHKVLPHAVNSPHRIFVTESRFREHLHFFKKRGFYFLSFRELADFWFERKPLAQWPRRPLILTFDDGYRNLLIHAMPHLEKLQVRATFFVLADHRILQNQWDPPESSISMKIMSLDEKKSLDKNLIEIGSHGLSHQHLPQLSSEAVTTDMVESQRILERDLEQKVVVYAYPFGDVDPRLPALAQKAGYTFAVNTDQGPLNWGLQRHSMFRVNIFPEDGLWQLWRKTSSGYRRRYFRKRGR